MLQTSFPRQSEPCLYISLFLRKEIRVLDSFALLRLKGSTSTKKITEREEDNIPHLLYIYIYIYINCFFICLFAVERKDAWWLIFCRVYL